MKPQEAQPRHIRDRRPRPVIEPLEQRIAPALLVNGANLLGGSGNPTTGQGSIGGNALTLVTVTSGEAIVWYDHGYIDAISFGPNTSLNVVGDIGALIGNLNSNGTLTNSTGSAANGLDGGVLLPNNLVGLTTHPIGGELGSVGAIITGGTVSNVNISGDLGNVDGIDGGIYAGNGAFNAQSHILSKGEIIVPVASPYGTALDVNPILPGPQSEFTITIANDHYLSGASISNVKIGAADATQLIAGDGTAGTAGSHGHAGTPGLAGGSISNITVSSAFTPSGAPAGLPSYLLLAGAGGNGSKGGIGGSISNVTEVSSNGLVNIIAGPGGNAASGAGGAGGSVKNLSLNSDSSAYTVHAGAGGNGAPGGAGGSVKGVNFGGDQLSNGIVVAAPFTGHNGVDDILLVDAQTGTMVIETYVSGTGWTPVAQDQTNDLYTIAPEGSTPIGAVAVDVNNDGFPDIVVAYKNSDSLGVYVNQGGGVFYTRTVGGSDTLDATTIGLPYAPEAIAAGIFTGTASDQDIAVALNNQGTSELFTLIGNGQGQFTIPSVAVALPAAPVNLIAADIQNSSSIPYSDLFASFKTGQIDALLATGSLSGAPFNPAVSTGITISGGLANIDWDSQEGILLALNAAGNTITTYGVSTSGTLGLEATVPLTGGPGTALVAHFVPNPSSPSEPIDVLSSVGSGSRLDIYSPEGETYTLTTSIASTEALRNFTPVIEGQTADVAAVGTSVEHFAISQNGGPFTDVSLPFSGKTVTILAGNGGNGDLGSVAAGGIGGSISSMSIVAGQITLQAGDGGSSINAPGGAGGTITDTPTFVTQTGSTVSAILQGDTAISIDSGNGGSSTGGASHSAFGGAGGKIQGLNISLLSGDIVINGGTGGNGTGGAGGAGGSVLATKATDNGGDLDISAGGGGNAGSLSGNGGVGGSITTLTYTLAPEDLTAEVGYNVNLIAGGGGASSIGIGGAGGSVQTVTMSVESANESFYNPGATPPTTHADVDSTVRINMTGGNGGNGAIGGAGGALTSINSTSVFSQIIIITEVNSTATTTITEINPVAATLISGTGGNGTKGAGGAGGAISSVTLSGISHYDPDDTDPQAGNPALKITSGNGGNGATTGGAAGAITGVVAQNAQFIDSGAHEYLSGTELSSAAIVSGTGGNGGITGGAGGTITNISVAVSSFAQENAVSVDQDGAEYGGQLAIVSGNGGNGGAAGKGGAAGSIIGSVVGAADIYEPYGILLNSGVGGNGGLGGGAGGNIANIQISSPQNATPLYDTSVDFLSTLLIAGNGGQATASGGIGGTGGSIGQISESKDVNTPINLLQAGNGGAAVTTGGSGGSVIGVNTVGLIGQASDEAGNRFGVFQTNVVQDDGVFESLFPYNGNTEVPQGVFAGNGGTGATAGAQGSVMSISAAQIAAIGAAMDVNGLFGAAARVANITAQSIAYDQNGNGLYDNVTGTNKTAPGQVVPIDGFIFSETTPTGINTLDNALLEQFTFVG